MIKYNKRVDIKLTTFEIEQIRRCYLDIVYFAENYFKMIDPRTGNHTIKLYDYQKKYLRRLVNNKKNMTVTSRQLGITTMNEIYLLWCSIFKRNFNIGYFPVNYQNSKRVCSDFKYAYENLPGFIKPGVSVYNQNRISFDNGNDISFSYINGISLRGLYLNLVIVDDLAFATRKNCNEFWHIVFSCISENGQISVNSCPNGNNNPFYDIVKNCGPEWNIERTPWHVNSKLDEEWAENTKRYLSEKSWRQQYLCDFTEE